MAFKDRVMSDELKLLRSVNTRMKLPYPDRKNFEHLLKGFEGEIQFDALTEKLQSPLIILNDLFLEVNGSKFQLDSVLLSPNSVYPCEIKNFEGDYNYHTDRLYIKNGPEVKDPLQQVERSLTLLRILFQKYGFSFPIDPYLIYVNPEFTLYNAPLNDSIIFPTQLNRFMKKLNGLSGNLNGEHRKLCDLLVSLHMTESPYTRLPPYSFEQIKKGVTCGRCHSFLNNVVERKFVCGTCGVIEEMDSAVIRSVEELKLLFPDKPITTSIVFEWCKAVESPKTIRRILKQNYKEMGKYRHTYYE
ncbi:nuclease-related domain-containing protein [Neobacillus niacini]|uniref:nuclease-related domain-containing protein n=1 Tax=Neobacillus niacini TaxID=86668 RepID=UPI003982FC5A